MSTWQLALVIRLDHLGIMFAEDFIGTNPAVEFCQWDQSGGETDSHDGSVVQNLSTLLQFPSF